MAPAYSSWGFKTLTEAGELNRSRPDHECGDDDPQPSNGPERVWCSI